MDREGYLSRTLSSVAKSRTKSSGTSFLISGRENLPSRRSDPCTRLPNNTTARERSSCREDQRNPCYLGTGGVDLLGPTSCHRIVSLGRVDKAARWNAQSAQCDFAQIEKLKVRLEQQGRAGPAFESLEVHVLEAGPIGNISKYTLHQGAPGRGRGIQPRNHVS